MILPGHSNHYLPLIASRNASLRAANYPLRKPQCLPACRNHREYF